MYEACTAIDEFLSWLREELKRFKGSDAFRSEQALVSVSRPTEINYGSGMSTQGGLEIRTVPARGNSIKFAEQVMKSEPAKHCLAAIEGCVGLDAHPIHLRQIAYRLFDDDRWLNDGGNAAVVAKFIRDLEKGPVVWNVEVPVCNLLLPEEPIELDKHARLRRPTEADFVVEKDAAFASMGIGGRFDDFANPWAFLEFEMMVVDQKPLNQFIRYFQTALLLYTLSSPYIVGPKYVPDSFTRHSSVSGSRRPRGIHYKAEFTETDIDSFPKHLAVIRKLIWDRCSAESIAVPIDSYQLAIGRLWDSCMLSKTHEEQIATSISAIEALLLRDDERSELSHRLAQRASVLLGFGGRPPWKCFRDLKSAYGVRSMFVHGAVDTERNPKMGNLARDTTDMARELLGLAILLENELPKEELIGRLDKAMLIPKSLERLREKVDAASNGITETE